MIAENTPYTYYLEWPTGMKYYGVSYSKACHPDDLWSLYKTSSDYVKEHVSQFGNPVRTEVRKIFTGHDRIARAISWEARVLDRLNAAYREDYLNKRNSKAINCTDPVISAKRNRNMITAINTPKSKEKRRCTDLMPETKEKRRLASLKRESDPIKKNDWISKTFSEEAINKRKKSVAITNALPEVHEKRSRASIEVNSRPEILLANQIRLLGVTWEERIGDTASKEYKKKMGEFKREWHLSHPYAGERSGLNSPCADRTLYVWKHTKTEQVISLTRTEFCAKYGIDNAGLQVIIKKKNELTSQGKPYSIKGWILLS